MSDQMFVAGDVVFSVATVIEINNTTPVSLPAGSWFANGYELWSYLIRAYNDDAATSVTVALGVNGAVTVTHGGSDFTVLADSGDVARAVTALGLVTASETQSGATFVSEPIGGWLAPVFPLVAYDIGANTTEGYTAITADGSVYSLAGEFTEYRDLTLAFDYTDASYTELHRWKELINDWLRYGRAMTLCLDHDLVPSGVPTEPASLVYGESLTLGAAPDRVATQRVVEYSDDTILRADVVRFRVRRPFTKYLNTNPAYEGV